MAARLVGKRVFITGAAAGIGAAAARLFAAEGASVALADVDIDRGREVARDCGGEALFVETDVAKPASVEAALEVAVERFDGLDVLYNNAGGATMSDGSLLDISLDEFWRTVSVDLYGTFLCCRFAIPHMRAGGGGAIVNTASIRALKGTRGADAYTAAKGGVIALTRAMALECAPMGIRVNAIAPGAVLTERTRAMGLTSDDVDHVPHPLRTGRPEEVAQLALYLVSDEASLVNGAIIPVDSGASAF